MDGAECSRDLIAHEAALLVRVKQLREQIIPLERELAQVRRAKGALSNSDYGPEQQMLFVASVNSKDLESSSLSEADAGRWHSESYRSMTIKDLIRKALADHFGRGATANELLEFFETAWGRSDIARTSLSPQLSRLKANNEIVLDGQKWVLRHPREIAPAPTKTATDQ